MKVNITRRTLLRYEKGKLIPEPLRGGLGQGRGRVTNYPNETAEEAYAAYMLMHGEPSYKPETVMRIRECARNVIDGTIEVDDCDPSCIYWITFTILFKEKIDPSGSYWISCEYTDKMFGENFKEEAPRIPPNVNINFESTVTVIYYAMQGIVVKQWNPDKKYWKVIIIDHFKNTD
nr:hypothetical protein [Sporomusa silvacetica]